MVQRLLLSGFMISANSVLSCGSIACLNHLHMTEQEFICTQAQFKVIHSPFA